MKHPPLKLTFCVLLFPAANFTTVKAQDKTMLKAEKISSKDLPPEVLDAYKNASLTPISNRSSNYR